MRIVFLSPPFSGHLHPIIGIAKHLQSSDLNLEIFVISTSDVRDKITSENLCFIPIMQGHEKDIAEIADPSEIVGNNPVKLYKQLRSNIRLLSKMKVELVDILTELKSDLIISDFTIILSHVVAQELNIRWWTSLPSPCVYEDPKGVPPYFKGEYPAKSIFGSMRHRSLFLLTRIFKKCMFSLFSKELKQIGVRSLYRPDNSESVYSPELVLALGMKEMEFNHHDSNTLKFVGPVLHTPSTTSISPEFKAEKKHVLVTLGTHLKFAKHKIIEIINDFAWKYQDFEFHISLGSDKGDLQLIDKSTLLSNMSVYDFVDYNAFIHEYRFVIHHGGSGIMYHCIKNEIPSLVIPQDYDQFDNAARIDFYGVGVWCKKKLMIEYFFDRLVRDPYYPIQCKKLSSDLENYNPLEFIENRINFFDFYVP